MSETYRHTFGSGRICAVRVRYRRGDLPILRVNPKDFLPTPEEFPEYLEWRKLVALQLLGNLDPAALVKMEQDQTKPQP